MARQLSDKNKKTEDKRQALLDFIARFSANASKSRQATARKKALEKLTIEEIQPSNRKYPGIIFQPLREVGNQILSVENLSRTVDGRKLFDKVAFTVNKGDKIAFVSRDPLAVTQFFEIISGNAQPDGGKYEWGTTVSRAYLPVEHNQFFTQGLSLLEWLRQYVPPHVTDADEPFLRGFLGKMLFSGDDILKKTDVLSGGEKVRCMISRMMIYGLAACSLNLILGYGGLVSFGHAAYLGIGAYTVGILITEGMPNGWLGFALAMAVSALLALIMASLGWAYDARLIRSVAMSLKTREFTQTSVFSGMSTREILWREHLPYVMPIVFSTTMNNMNCFACFAEVMDLYHHHKDYKG
jgi:hypothetical protein